ncbi:MAG: hypothetical protein JXQ90_03810 [Cyclobacteriaceae bacterium]
MNQFENARNIAHILLAEKKQKNKKISSNDILEVANNPLLKGQYPDVDFDSLVEQLQSDLDIYSAEATQLVEQDVKPWLNDQKASINPELWNRYRLYIKSKDGSFPIDNLDDLTDKILDKCVNPKTTGNWDRRGMVVGNVQSGKTANYTGLINKATDAGYKLIIVIAGIHNALRSQTQVRIDEGYIGRNSSDFIEKQRTTRVGVGKYSAETEVYSYTSTNKDFNRGIATQLNVPIGGKSPTVLVIKKNKSILENLILWLNQFRSDGSGKINNVPVLVIDDEADNASVNSGDELDVKTINRLIRTLLNLFSQNTFIGYTATPYANLFIPSSWSENLETMVKDLRLNVGEDLFPRDFIVNIPPPSNYIGAAQVFGFENSKTGEQSEGLDIIRLAEDQEPEFPRTINKNNKDNLPEDIPLSLKKAVQAFILTCAIRRKRGQEKKHNSMLVHVVVRVAWIDRIAWLVNEVLRDYKNQLKSGQGNLEDNLKSLFEADYAPTTIDVLNNIGYNDPKIKNHKWEEIQPHVLEAISKIEVRAVHGVKNTRFLEYHNIGELNYDDYDNGFSVIAVGGSKLSRGITLEGLSVSYYLRTTRMYDSLMQMGRWFGYRPGYVDLCRLYTTEQLISWYRHITMATEEMREDFDEMAAKNLTPKDFQLKVRTHSGMLQITSISKMKEHEKIQLSFSGETKQTYEFDNDQKVVNSNFELLEMTLKRLKDATINHSKSGNISSVLFNNIKSDIVEDFLASYQSKNNHMRTDVLKDYIRKQNQSGHVPSWSIALILTSSSKVGSQNEKIKGKNTIRKTFKLGDDKIENVGIASRSLKEVITLLETEGSSNAILDKASRIIDLEATVQTSEAVIKAQRKEKGSPLLVLLPLDPRVSSKLDEATPLVGFGIVFPELNNEEKYEYAARPLLEDFERTPQESDENEDDD